MILKDTQVKPPSPNYTVGRNNGPVRPSFYGQHANISCKELVNCIILAKMYDYGVPKEKFEEIQTILFKILIDDMLESNSGQQYELVFEECDKLLPTLQFKTELKDMLDEENKDK